MVFSRDGWSIALPHAVSWPPLPVVVGSAYARRSATPPDVKVTYPERAGNPTLVERPPALLARPNGLNRHVDRMRRVKTSAEIPITQAAIDRFARISHRLARWLARTAGRGRPQRGCHDPEQFPAPTPLRGGCGEAAFRREQAKYLLSRPINAKRRWGTETVRRAFRRYPLRCRFD
jgi:hypothetical protein